MKVYVIGLLLFILSCKEKEKFSSILIEEITINNCLIQKNHTSSSNKKDSLPKVFCDVIGEGKNGTYIKRRILIPVYDKGEVYLKFLENLPKGYVK